MCQFGKATVLLARFVVGAALVQFALAVGVGSVAASVLLVAALAIALNVVPVLARAWIRHCSRYRN